MAAKLPFNRSELVMTDFQPYLSTAIDAAKQAGELLMCYLGKVQAKEKQPRDLVTQADIESQALIKSILLEAFPEHGFLGEEGDESDVDAEFCWIVDPLDGTTNFVYQLPTFAVSIGLRYGADVVLGVIYDPLGKECFSAVKGQGAFMNGKSIRTGECNDIEKSLLVCSFPSRVERDSIEVQRFLNVLTKSTVRRMGSAAINCCYVACGRLDGYWATNLSVWDVAAGVVIAREAGASVTDLTGEPFDLNAPRFVMAGTEALHQQLLEQMTVVE